MLFYAIVGFFVGLLMMYNGVKKYLLLQKIKNTPTSTVRSAAVGLVELSGKALCEKDNISPISATKCPFWSITAQYYQSGKNGGWKQIFQLQSAMLFYLEDDTGRMLIDPLGAKVEINNWGKYHDVTYQGYISGKGMFGVQHAQMDQKVLDFVGNLGPAIKKNFMNHKNEDVRVFEDYITEGEPLYVLGSAEPREGVQSSVGHENLVVRRGMEKVMYISDSHETGVTKNMSGGVYFSIFGGLGLSAICLLIILGLIGL